MKPDDPSTSPVTAAPARSPPGRIADRGIRICVVTPSELSRTHGTGAQLLHLLSGTGPHQHFYWQVSHGGQSEVAWSTCLPEWPSRRPGFRRPARVLAKISGTAFWYGNTPGWRAVRAIRRGRPTDVALAVVGDEASAARARSILDVVRRPYVVLVYDIMSSEGFPAGPASALRTLFAGASDALGLTPPIRLEIEKLGTQCTPIMVGQPETPQIAQCPDATSAARLVLTGRPYAGGALLLSTALTALRERWPRLKVCYVGPHYAALPESLKTVTANLGFVDDDAAFRETLAGCHLGYLTGPDTLDAFGRFSFPSRVGDLLMAGLPVLSAAPPGTATARVLAPITPLAVRPVSTVDSLCDAVAHWLGSAAGWQAASDAARNFALENLSITAARATLFASLERAIASQSNGG